MEKKEKKLEKARSIAISEVNSSMMLDSVVLLICNEVITTRQNPRRLADVFSICCEVVFAIFPLSKSVFIKLWRHRVD
jgi:hypothetical protein